MTNYISYFAPAGWTITYNPKPIPNREHDYDFVHDNYDGENGLCGTAKDYLNAIHNIFEIIRDGDMAHEVIGKPAPDISHIDVALSPDGKLTVKEEAYTGNTYTNVASVVLGMHNGKFDKKMAMHKLGMTFINREPTASGVKYNGYTVTPGADIQTSGWCQTDHKEKYIQTCKEVIRLSLVNLIDQSKTQLVNLMQPAAAIQPAQDDDSSLSMK
jgi:hypothetical protein